MSSTEDPQRDEGMERIEQLIAEILLAEERGMLLDNEHVNQMLDGEADEVIREVREFLLNHRAMQGDSATGSKPQSSKPVAPGDATTLGGPALPPTVAIANPWGVALNETVVQHYDLIEELGRGGMGVVYRGRDQRLGQDVAVKLLMSTANHDPLAVERFYAEAKTAAQLSHPGIVPVFEVGEDQGRHFYAMALVEGVTLSERLMSDGTLSPLDAAELVREVSLAVQYAHEHGVIHRDIKPANLMIDTHGAPKLMDFGLAKRPEQELDLTMTGQILGTLAFMSPEQASGRNELVGPPTDIYALGALLFTALTGRAPFQGESQAELLVKVITAEPPIPVVPRSAADLARICLRCLEKKPADRYSTATELADDLNAFLHGEPVKAVVNWRQKVRKWVRRQPSLAAHLMAISSVEVVRHVKVFFGDPNPNDLRITATLGIWAVLCIVAQAMVNRLGESARYVWPLVDLVSLTSVLALTEDPHGPLLVTYPLVIVFCGLLFRVRLIVAATLGAVAAYLVLLGVRASSDPPHYHVLMVLMLALTGTVVGAHVRRLRLLDEVYQRRQR